MNKKAQARTVRRTFALPGKLVEEALLVNSEEKANLNQILTIALQEYVNNRKRLDFEKSMLAMGSDPEVLRECAAINKDLIRTEGGGLRKNKQ